MNNSEIKNALVVIRLYCDKIESELDNPIKIKEVVEVHEIKTVYEHKPLSFERKAMD